MKTVAIGSVSGWANWHSLNGALLSNFASVARIIQSPRTAGYSQCTVCECVLERVCVLESVRYVCKTFATNLEYRHSQRTMLPQEDRR